MTYQVNFLILLFLYFSFLPIKIFYNCYWQILIIRVIITFFSVEFEVFFFFFLSFLLFIEDSSLIFLIFVFEIDWFKSYKDKELISSSSSPPRVKLVLLFEFFEFSSLNKILWSVCDCTVLFGVYNEEDKDPGGEIVGGIKDSSSSSRERVWWFCCNCNCEDWEDCWFVEDFFCIVPSESERFKEGIDDSFFFSPFWWSWIPSLSSSSCSLSKIVPPPGVERNEVGWWRRSLRGIKKRSTRRRKNKSLK